MSALLAFLEELHDRYGDLGPNPKPAKSISHDLLISENGAMLSFLAKYAVMICEATTKEDKESLIEELIPEIEKFEQIIRQRLVP